LRGNISFLIGGMIMLTSIAIILLLGFISGQIFTKMKLPSLIGMILVGILISPYCLDLMDESILSISKDIRQIALVIILTRAGLSLNIKDLKKVGRPAFLMCFVPACIEIIGTLILAPLLFDITWIEALIIGSVMAAVSPAVIVPRMIRLIDEGYGKENSIPQLILAGASVDDVFVIVLFTAFTGLASTGELSMINFIQIPISIILGILFGFVVGFILLFILKKTNIHDTLKVIIMLSISFLILEVEILLKNIIPISGLLAIMSMGIIIKQKDEEFSKKMASKYNQLWSGAEIFLFVLVGVAVDVRYAFSAGIAVILLVIGALIFRMFGVFISLLKTKLTKNERIFCMLSYTPKATVQAAIGTIPLTMGLACGELVLTVAVMSILLTAPFGAICVDHFHQKLLKK